MDLKQDLFLIAAFVVQAGVLQNSHIYNGDMCTMQLLSADKIIICQKPRTPWESNVL